MDSAFPQGATFSMETENSSMCKPPKAVQAPTSLPQFPRLPSEIRQQIFYQALPKEERIISIEVITTLLSVILQEKEFVKSYVLCVGASVRVGNLPVKARLLRSSGRTFEHVIQPVETQHVIVSLSSVNREARAVTCRVYPDVIPLRVYPLSERFFDRLQSICRRRCSKLVHALHTRGARDDDYLLTLSLRCSLDHDIFHFTNITVEYEEAKWFRRWNHQRNKAQLDGSRILRALTRMALMPWIRHDVQSESRARKLVSGGLLSLEQLLQVDKDVNIQPHEERLLALAPVECEECSKRGCPKHSHHYKYLERASDGALLKKPTARPSMFWEESVWKSYEAFLNGEENELELLGWCLEAQEDLQALFAAEERRWTEDNRRLMSGWVRVKCRLLFPH